MTQYAGGKSRVGKKIHNKIREYEYLKTGENNLPYLEPFLGMGGVMKHIASTDGRPIIIGCDYEKCIMSFWKGIQSGWEPVVINKEEYLCVKNACVENDPSYAFTAFGCSFRGLKWGGFCQSGMERAIKRISLQNYKEIVKNVLFLDERSYEKHSPSGMLIYLDPPYINSTFDSRKNNLKYFNCDVFWVKVREWSVHNIVIVSEREAPDDFECIYEFERQNGINQTTLTEKLFVYN